MPTAMKDTAAVDRAPGTDLQVVSTKYPADRAAMLEVIRRQRRDRFVSETVRAALDEFIERHLPGVIGRADGSAG